VVLTHLNANTLFSSLNNLDENDLVILDPPYPGDHDSKNATIFFRPENDGELYSILLEIIEQLNKNNVNFI
jgi:16S rRNA G966 N2-methylase RsmD